MAEKSTRLIPVILGATVAVTLVIGGSFWFIRATSLQKQYMLAAADCENGRGADLLAALDAVHGEEARPKDLQLSLTMCALSDGVDSYLRSQAAADALSR